MSRGYFLLLKNLLKLVYNVKLIVDSLFLYFFINFRVDCVLNGVVFLWMLNEVLNYCICYKEI